MPRELRTAFGLSILAWRGSGYSTETDEIDVADFLLERGEGQRELVRILGALLEDSHNPVRT